MQECLMDQTRLHRARHSPPPHLTVMGDMSLRLARAHEFCGTARRTLALMVAARLSGPVIWIRPSWQAEALNPDGVLPWIDPGRLIFVAARRTEDLLWSAEESLRAGAVALVVTELPIPPALTPVRRLHLAAETGAQAAATPPLGLLLTPGTGGAAGVESRWTLMAAHGAATMGWRLVRRRARTAPPKSWHMAADLTLTSQSQDHT